MKGATGAAGVDDQPWPPDDQRALGRLDLLAGKQPTTAHDHLDTLGNDQRHGAEQVVDLDQRLGSVESCLAQVEVDRAEDRSPR